MPAVSRWKVTWQQQYESNVCCITVILLANCTVQPKFWNSFLVSTINLTSKKIAWDSTDFTFKLSCQNFTQHTIWGRGSNLHPFVESRKEEIPTHFKICLKKICSSILLLCMFTLVSTVSKEHLSSKVCKSTVAAITPPRSTYLVQKLIRNFTWNSILHLPITWNYVLHGVL